MSLRLRLLVLFTVLMLVVVLAASAVIVALRNVEGNRALVTERLQPASAQSRALLMALSDQETGERGYLLTGDAKLLQTYRDGGSDLAERLAELRRDFRGDPEMTATLDRVAEGVSTWRRAGAIPEIRARRSGAERRAEALVATGRSQAAYDEARARVSDVQSLIDTRAQAAQQRVVDDLRTLRNVILFSRSMVILLLVLGALLMRRWVLTPVQRLRSRMRAVADGRIDEQVLIDGPPEVVALGRDAESMRRRIVAELDAARAATEALTQHSPVVSLLRSELTSRPRAEANGLEVAGMVLSAEGVLAGDWWEAFRRPDGTTALVLADVSGHGAEAGLVAFAFKQRIIALLDSDLDLADVFELAARRPEDAERFLSCVVIVVDPEAQRLSWVNAGHPAALVVDREHRDIVRELGPTGPLISAVTSGWVVATTLFGPEDMLVACTDGVLEARNSDGQEFGVTGLVEVMKRLDRWSPDEAVVECREAVRRFAVDVRRDDVTCVALALAPERDAAHPG
jgi:CHASE3 domain sensor protein/serine phosphatase RsbU (regulator of sigma subunit)